MPNQRSEKKRMLGAQVDEVVHYGIALWRSRNLGKTKTDFLLEASLQFLDAQGIKIDKSAALNDRRPRREDANLPEPQSGDYRLAARKRD